MAIVSGIVGLTAVELLQSITSRLVLLPQQREIDPSQFPVVTVALWVIMSAIVAGVAEEASFRGYIQGPIERRHGPVVAVLVTGSLFGFAHFSHPEVGLILMPYYLLVAAVYGATAYFTNSIYPGLVLHAGGNMLGTLNLLTRGASEWQASPPSVPLVWETGTDISFWMTIAGFIAALAGAIAAFASLRRIVRSDARFPAAP
jgi:membrane protease YdiL (CAAX protease family)